MIQNTQGIVLRLVPFSDTSLIVRWLTPDHGRISTLARGALRPKSPFRGRLDLFHLARISFAASHRSTLHTLREVSLIETHPLLRHEWLALQRASYAARLVEQTTESDTPLPETFALLRGWLAALATGDSGRLQVLAFEARVLRESGQFPDPLPRRIGPGSRAILRRLLGGEWDQLSRLRPAHTQFDEMEMLLRGLLLEHWDRLPEGRSDALRPTSQT